MFGLRRAAPGGAQVSPRRITAGPPFLIRPARIDDLEAISAIQQAAYGDRWLDSILFHELSRPDGVAYIGSLGGTRICFAIGVVQADCRHIFDLLAVAPAWQGEGYGSALVAAMFPSWPCARRRVTVRVHERLVGGQLFLRKCGFTCERILRGAGVDREDVYEFDRSK